MLDLNKLKTEGALMFVMTDDWVLYPDGNQYKGFWGWCKIIEAKELFGFRPAGDANWFLQIGRGENAMLIAGCRIHYAVFCKTRPTAKDVLCLE